MTLVEKSIIYATDCHLKTNHLYDGQPYTFHLVETVAWAEKFNHWIPKEMYDTIISACWCHDVIEDCRQTYHDVMRATSFEVAEIVYALTNEKGRDRAERANLNYYQEIKKTPGAYFVKLCDRLANVEYSLEKKSMMLQVYRLEYNSFWNALANEHGPLTYHDMWFKLQEMLFRTEVK